MSESRPEKVVFSFFGPPGSGKGTLAGMCKRKLGFSVLSTGNLCRKHVSLGTDFGKMLDEYLSQGRLIPDELVTSMVQDWLQDAIEKGKPVILDGFPRTERQAELFVGLLKVDYPGYQFKVVSFEISDDEVVRRLTARLMCGNKSCQSVYSAAVPPKQSGICDYCGSQLIRRADDAEDVIRERLKYFPAYKRGLFDFYRSIEWPIEHLNVSHVTPEELFEKFRKLGQNSTFTSAKIDGVLDTKAV